MYKKYTYKYVTRLGDLFYILVTFFFQSCEFFGVPYPHYTNMSRFFVIFFKYSKYYYCKMNLKEFENRVSKIQK